MVMPFTPKWGAPGDLIESVFWEGIPRIEEFSYTCSHGVAPGVWQLVTAPAEGEPDVTPGAVGTLYFSDGFRTVALRNAKVDRIDGRQGPDGITYTLSGFDRRWLWRNQWGGLGGIRGRYNQTDRRGKLVPWSIRSPAELARLLLREMGESNFVVDLPPGLPRAVGANLDRFLRLGEFFPQTNTNPETAWDRTPPADALAWLADLFGCRVVYQPVSDRVLVVPLGKGAARLPDYPYEVLTPNVDDPETPAGVASRGAPVRIQCRLPLEPVAEEWDGSYLPLDLVSYAPKVGGDKPQSSTINFTGADPTLVPGPTLEVTITWGTPPKSVTLRSTDPALSANGQIADVLAQLAANPDAKAAGLTGTAGVGGVFTLTGPPGLAFTVTVTTPGGPDAWGLSLDQQAVTGGRGWHGTNVPLFSDVIATDRLSYFEALAKARGSVFRVFRVLREAGRPCAPDTRKPPLKLPWFGEVVRVQQLTLQGDKVQQVVPQARIAGGVNAGSLIDPAGTIAGQGIMPEFYNGKSRNAEAVITGSVWLKVGGKILWDAARDNNQNTLSTDRVFVDWTLSTDQFGNQLIVFSEPVYAYDPKAARESYILYPQLTIETGVVVTDFEADALVRWEKVLPVPGGLAPVEWHNHDDLQVGIVGRYATFAGGTGGGAGGDFGGGGSGGTGVIVPPQQGAKPAPPGLLHKLLGWDYAPGDLEHATSAADWYNLNHAKKYEVVFGDTRQFVGIWPVNPDGTVHQVSWSMGQAGPTTVASLNGEHSAWVPAYVERRRAEVLAPNALAAVANLAEYEAVGRILAGPSGPAVK